MKHFEQNNQDMRIVRPMQPTITLVRKNQGIKTLIRFVIGSLLLLIIAGNKYTTTFVHIGSLYLYGMLVPVVFLLSPKKLFRQFVRFPQLTMILAYVLCFLVADVMESGRLSVLMLRNSALFLYMVTPFVLLDYRKRLGLSLVGPGLSLYIALLVFVILNPGDFHSTMAAEISGACLLMSLMFNLRQAIKWIAGISYVLAVTGVMAGQSPFRTPMMTFILASIFVVVLTRKRRISLAQVFMLTCVALFALLAVTSGVANHALGDLLIGLSGYTHSDAMKNLGVSLGGVLHSTRGNAAGTASTRILFWGSILRYQFTHPISLIFGYGLQHGFLDVTLPHLAFENKSLVAPHNSFIDIFFRFGILGLAMTGAFLFKLARWMSRRVGWRRSIPFIVYALAFGSNEVALENPQGAVIFWTIFLMPVLASELPRLSAYQHDLHVRGDVEPR